MAYCTNCGNKIKENSKFCPNCGTKIETLDTKIERKPPPKRRMEKGAVKSLKKEIKNTVTSKIENTISNQTLSKNILNDNDANPKIKDNKAASSLWKSAKKTIIFYLLLSILLLILQQKSDEITGVQYFSIFILVAYAFRHKKEKPFNWLLKILLTLQLILIFSIFMTQLEFFFYNLFSFLAGLTLLGLFIVNLLLLFKGNKN